MKNTESDPISYMIVFQFLVTFMILIYMLVTKTPFPRLDGIWGNILASGILVSLGSVTMFQALKHTKAGEYTIISTFSAFVNLVVSSLFLKEIFTLNKLLGTVLIVSSIFIITKFNKAGEKLKLNKGHFYSLISATCFGIAFANDSYIAAQLGVIQCLLVIFFVPGLLVSLTKPSAIGKMSTLLTKVNLIKMFSFSLLYLLGAITIFAAYTAGGDAGKIYGISNSSVIVTVILAAIFLGEKDQPMRKIVATATAFLGILLLR